jgi:hypothetical protein
LDGAVQSNLLRVFRMPRSGITLHLLNKSHAMELQIERRFCMNALKPPVRVTVDDHVTDGEGTTRYRLHVATHRCEWDILKRYSEVDALKKALLPKFVSVRSSELFFPPKKVKSDPKVIRERQELFQTWFAAIFSDVHVVCDASAIDFLQLNNLRRAVSAGDDRYIELLHSAGAPLTHDPKDADLLPLHCVCRRGFAACAEVILRSVEPKVRLDLMSKLDADGKSPLHLACAEGHTAVVALLLHHGCPPALNTKSGATPLHHAVRHTHFEIINLLIPAIIARGNISDLDLEDKKGRSPLHFAVHFRLRHVVQLLLSSGASIAHREMQSRSSVAERDKTGHTVFHIAAALNAHEMLRVCPPSSHPCFCLPHSPSGPVFARLPPHAP